MVEWLLRIAVVPSLIYTFAHFCASQVVHSDYTHDLSGGTVIYTIDVTLNLF
jgi:hypothetical protein